MPAHEKETYLAYLAYLALFFGNCGPTASSLGTRGLSPGRWHCRLAKAATGIRLFHLPPGDVRPGKRSRLSSLSSLSSHISARAFISPPER